MARQDESSHPVGQEAPTRAGTGEDYRGQWYSQGQPGSRRDDPAFMGPTRVAPQPHVRPSYGDPRYFSGVGQPQGELHPDPDHRSREEQAHGTDRVSHGGGATGRAAGAGGTGGSAK